VWLSRLGDTTSGGRTVIPREPFSTFKEKVARLEDSSLKQFMTAVGWKVSWDFENNRPGDEARMPELESLEAYILNLRFFIQDNEPTSLRNLAAVYSKECRDQRYLEQFTECEMR
jgi:DNA-directed RNA polymerase sigma subunit (sigma70/sigma32)